MSVLCRLAFWAALLSLGCSCRTVPRIPAAEVTGRAWNVLHGQAVWQSRRNVPEIAGELLWAQATNNACVIQFIKTPVPLAVGQLEGNLWQIEFSGQRRFSGRSTPPKHFGWLQLAMALSGRDVVSPWKFHKSADGSWRIENPRSGEAITGFLGQ